MQSFTSLTIIKCSSTIFLSSLDKKSILKICRVLGPRWAACGLRAVQSVWRDYPVLYEFVCSDTRFLGMAARMSNQYFQYYLVLMLDILQEMYLFSNALLARSVSLPMTEKINKKDN